MKRGSLITSLVVVLALVGIVIGFLVAGVRPQLGLDLRGGISAIYSPVFAEGEEPPEDFDEVLDETISLIRERVDSLGVAEPDISRQGDNVLVQLPGLDDPERAREVIGTTAKMTFRPVFAVVSPGTEQYDSLPACGEPVDESMIQGLSQPPSQPTPGETAPPAPGDTPAPAATPEDVEEEPTALSTDGATGSLGRPGGTVTGAQDATTEPAESPTGGSATQTPAPAEETATEGAEGETDAGTDAGTDAEGDGTLRELPDDQPGVLCGSPDDAGQPVGGADGGEGDGGTGGATTKYVVGEAALTGDLVDDAFPQLPGGGAGEWSVALDLSNEGGTRFANITGELACMRDQGQPGLLAIVLDNIVESAPQMNPSVQCGEGITGGRAQITTGGADPGEAEEEARDLALVLKTGALPITLQASTFETVSPTLGQESLESGLLAGLIGLALVGLYLIFFYRWLGAVILGALTIFGVLMLGLITAMGQLGFALTLAGIAGIVVAIGITADSSIIFMERIRDEVALGKTMRTGVKKAFDNAFRTNLAGNTVTLAAALILYFLAVGPVRGFALTLGIATVLDILIMYFYTRPVVSLLSQNRRMLTRRSVRVPDTSPGAAPAGGGTS